MTTQRDLIDIFNAALAAVDPYQAVLDTVRLEHNYLHVAATKYKLASFKRIVVVGAGKATPRMAMAIEKLLASRISTGLIIVKQGHQERLTIIQQVEAAHPVPNQAGVNATQKILEMAQLADAETLFICLISGGASALLVAPITGVTLADKQELTNLLLHAGANIVELNTVRKHLSAVKGGRLVQAAYPAQIITLILSDVIGDRLDVIASGPTAPDTSSFADAWAVIEKYQLANNIPPRVLNHLKLGCAGKMSETLKPDDAYFYKSNHVIVAGNPIALAAAKEKALQLGFPTQIVDTEIQGEARDAARFLAAKARSKLGELQANERYCLLSGGETTVSIKGVGKGGRNQELALAFAMEIDGLAGVTLLSAASDGSDGPNDAAGAMVNGSTAAQARQLGVEPSHYLDANDSYHFFQKFDAVSGEHAHFITGPTGTNVMDLQIILLDKRK